MNVLLIVFVVIVVAIVIVAVAMKSKKKKGGELMAQQPPVEGSVPSPEVPSSEPEGEVEGGDENQPQI